MSQFSDIPIIKAASTGNHALLLSLIKQDEDVNVCDQEGWTPLMAIVLSKHSIAGASERYRCAELLLDNGADPKIKNGKDDVMSLAAGNYFSDIVKLLKDRGMKILESVSMIDFINRWPRPMFIDEIEGSIKIFHMMLAEEPDLNIKTYDGKQNTALHLACINGSREAIIELLRAGADKGSQNAESLTPIDLLRKAFGDEAVDDVLKSL